MSTDYEYPDASRRWDHSLLLPPLFHALESVPAGGSVLDLGCGNGAILSDIRKHGSWELYGVETSESGVSMAKGQGLNVYQIVPGADLAALFGARKFDLVYSVEVIEHVFDPRDFLARAQSVLHPDGRLLLTTPYHGYLKNLIVALLGKSDSHYNPLWDGGHIKFWSRKTLTALLVETGFKDIQFYGAGRFPWLWKSMVLTAKAA